MQNLMIQKSRRSTPMVVHRDKVKVCYSANQESWVLPSRPSEETLVDVATQCPEADQQLQTREDRRVEQGCDDFVDSEAVQNDQLESVEQKPVEKQVKQRSTSQLFNETSEQTEFHKPCRTKKRPAKFSDYQIYGISDGRRQNEDSTSRGAAA